MRRIAGHALKGLAWLASPVSFALLIATLHGWAGLAARPRLLAGWGFILVFSIVLPIFLFRSARAAIGHETHRDDRNVLSTGIAVVALAAGAAALTPWRDLAQWLATTLSQLTGFTLPVPAGTP